MLLDVVLGQDTALGCPTLQVTVYSERRRKLAFQSSDKSRICYTASGLGTGRIRLFGVSNMSFE